MASLWLGNAYSSAQPIDLPYESGSTGADGALAIPDSLPLWHNDDYAVQLAYDGNLGYLVATGRAEDGSRYLTTVGYVDGDWIDLARDEYLQQVALAYDEARSEIVRFGGLNYNSGVYQNSTYIWNGEEWDFRGVDGAPPERRGLHSMAYDGVRQEIVLFGGENDDGELGDTWVWNGLAWTERSPETSPSPRSLAAMAYDAAREKVVLFGGDDSGWENDTWTWDGAAWTEMSPTNTPPARHGAMAYDPTRSVVTLVVGNLSGEMETWEWDGGEWTKRSPSVSPPYRTYHGIVYDPDAEAIRLYNGEYDADSSLLSDSWEWNGTDWTELAVSPHFFDMAEKPDGVWHYTSIEVGRTVVEFQPNEANTPVVWLATDDVAIEGEIRLDGTAGYTGRDAPIHTPAPGGPGGFAGGLGGYFVTADGTNQPGFPGSGPGGGSPSLADQPSGMQDAYHGNHYSVYGSESLQSLVGGSGGGGAATTFFDAANEWGRGGNGGGGGGSILIAASGDIFLTGRISARGGEGGIESYKRASSSLSSTGSSRGGSGSGGAIRLVADRIVGGGRLSVETVIDHAHDYDEADSNNGRVRLEAYYHRVFIVGPDGVVSITYPRGNLLGAEQPTLIVDSIAGQGVSTNPSSDPASPEVSFSEAGAVEIVVRSQNVPDGTLVELRVTSGAEIITPDPVALSGGSASFSVTVPVGVGTVQAYSDWSSVP